MKFIIFLMTLTSGTSTLINHPMLMGMILLIQTILIALTTGMISPTFWFSYILFLIFIGGMLILFIYMTSLAPNEMISITKKMIPFLLFIMITVINFKQIQSYLHIEDNYLFINMNNSFNNQILKLYNMPTHFIVIMMGSYLFLSLIAVAKITNISMGPMRKMN
uniref:NADH dehydrogenase subunit 6 n=1 Tax=Margattea spinosa TaxID=1928776 RepID=UPI0027A0F13A|nr:NADH dehydrogenase subunit 6 [Margattea spinosa]WGO57324.1 NADH dehydrogenase subunit 6 [Margattea spinosa]